MTSVAASAIAPETEPCASLYDRLHDIETWRSIAPELTVTARLELDRHAPLDAPSCLTEQRIERMKSEGHFATSPLFVAARVARMASGVERVRAAGLHELCAIVYDEFWISLREASGIPESLLGPGYRLVPMPYVNYVAHDDNAAGFGPHRDRYDDPLTPDGMPTVITLWFALTDASSERACLYVLPTSRDPNFPRNLRAFQIGNVQDIRAVPVEAGAIVCFNQAILHWGSRNSRHAAGPRISFAFEFERHDAVPRRNPSVSLSSPLSFEERLGFLGAMILMLRDNNVTFSDGLIATGRCLAQAWYQGCSMQLG